MASVPRTNCPPPASTTASVSNSATMPSTSPAHCRSISIRSRSWGSRAGSRFILSGMTPSVRPRVVTPQALRRQALRRQALLHQRASLGKIETAGITLLQHRHDLAHVLQARGLRLRQHAVNGGRGFCIAHLLGQEALDDGDFLFFLLHQLRPVALLVEDDALMALLHHLLQHVDDLALADASGIAAGA